MLSEADKLEIGEFVAQKIQEYVGRVAILAYEGTVASLSTVTSPNGGTIQEAAVWFGIPESERTADNAVRCTVARHVTGLNVGDRVRVSRNSSDSQDWTVDIRR